jgi:two-component system phosphate regulon sensor histidine kinase PhoR
VKTDLRAAVPLQEVVNPQKISTQETNLVLEFFTAEMMAAHDELVKRTRKLEEANHRLQELDQLKTRLVGDVAHELRAPLASILLKIDLVERDKPENQERHLNDVRRQVRRLGHMIENILDLTRIYMTNPIERFLDVDVNVLISTVVKAHHQEALAANLSLVWKPGSNLPPVYGELEQLERAFTNLTGNAIKYTLAGTVTVMTRWDGDRNRVVVEIADTGIGIAPEDVPRLFSRFHRGRLAEAANITGTGLGLAIVKEIIEIHNGTIEVESEAGVGTRFRVLLPPRL